MDVVWVAQTFAEPVPRSLVSWIEDGFSDFPGVEFRIDGTGLFATPDDPMVRVSVIMPQTVANAVLERMQQIQDELHKKRTQQRYLRADLQ